MNCQPFAVFGLFIVLLYMMCLLCVDDEYYYYLILEWVYVRGGVI
jgi:hypothetical protein